MKLPTGIKVQEIATLHTQHGRERWAHEKLYEVTYSAPAPWYRRAWDAVVRLVRWR